MRSIPLSNGGVAQVNDEDYDRVSQYYWWQVKGRGQTLYAMGQIGKKQVLMHRFLMGCVHGEQIDHADRNGLNNVRSNLRLCNHSQNAANRLKRACQIFKGVYDKSRYGYVSRPFQAQIAKRSLGYFSTAVEAAHAYDTAARARWGEFALANFPV